MLKRKGSLLTLSLLLGAGLSCDSSTGLPTTGGLRIVLVAPVERAAIVGDTTSAAVIGIGGGTPLNVVLDGVRVTVTGPTNKTVSNSTPSGGFFDVTIDGLAPGSYSVTVEGLVGGEVVHFGQSTASVTAGASSDAPVVFQSFEPAVGTSAVPDTTDVLRFTVNYGAVPAATGYIVQWAKSPTMAGASNKTVTGNSTEIAVTEEGNYYVTVRAVNAVIPNGGKASAPQVVFAFQGVATVTVTPATPTIAFGATQQFTAEARDADNGVVPNVTWLWISSNQAAATVSQSGLATGIGGGQTAITAVGKGMPGSTNLGVTPPPASKLAFTVEPTNTTASVTIAAVKVAVQNALGQTVTSDNTTQVTMNFGTNAGGGTLSGGGTVTVSNGVATFNFMNVNKSGSGYTLTATATGLTSATSSAFNITPAVATQLVFIVQPTSTVAGTALSPAVQVEVRDASGNRVTSAGDPITIAIGTNPSSGALSGTEVVNAINGIASFSGLSIDNSGTGYTLAATSGSLTAATSTAFDLSALPPPPVAAKLAFVVQPTAIVAGSPLSPAVQVEVQDASGTRVSTASDAVTIALGTNPSGGALTGTQIVNAINGTASFSGVSIDKSGTGYTLAASSGSLTAAASAAFDVTALPAATTLAFSIQPTNSTAGDALSPAVQVEIRDASGKLVTTARDAVTLAIGANPGSGALTGTKVVNAINGIASFTGLWINKTGTGYTLAASAGGLTATTSTGFIISPAAPAKLAYSQQPTDVQGNVAMAPSVTVTITDQFDNPTTATNSVTLNLGDNPWKTPFSPGASLTGGQTTAAFAGVATFANLRVNKPAPAYSLAASSGALAGATSSGFNVNLTVQQISVGYYHTCTTTTGGAYCFGYNGAGQLGVPNTTTSYDSIAVLVNTVQTFEKITAGGQHSCGLTAAGVAYCWGQNFAGQLGNNSTTDSSIPVAVADGHVFSSIDAGSQYTCGVTRAGAGAEDRQVYCWGENSYGQIGDGTSGTNRLVPTRVDPTSGLQTARALSVSAGAQHTCARTIANAANNLFCWGRNYNGQLGDGAVLDAFGGNGADRLTPFPVTGGFQWTSVSAGENHTCAVSFIHSTSSPVRCWGNGTNGQLGNSASINTSSPVLVSSLNWGSVTAGTTHSCAVLSTGQAYCWGDNGNGQLGDDSPTSINSPVPVAGSLNFLSVDAAPYFSCGRTATAAYCWGYNYYGAHGSPGLFQVKRSPTQMVQ